MIPLKMDDTHCRHRNHVIMKQPPLHTHPNQTHPNSALGAPSEGRSPWPQQLEQRLRDYRRERLKLSYLWLVPTLIALSITWILLASWLAIRKPQWLLLLRCLGWTPLLTSLTYLMWQWRQRQQSMPLAEQLRTAQRIEHLLPQLGSSLTSAIRFAHRSHDTQGSPALMEGHGEMIVKNWPHQALAQRDQHQLNQWRTRGLPGVFLCFALLGYATWRSGQPLVRWLGLSQTSLQEPWSLPQKACIQNLQFDITPPAYTGKSKEQRLGSDGMLKAMAHSHIQLQAQLCEPAQAVFLVLQPEQVVEQQRAPSEEKAVEPAPTDKQPLLTWPVQQMENQQKTSFRHGWELLHTGPYWFVWQDQDGVFYRDRLERRMDALPDNPPVVRLEEPAYDQEVQPDGQLQLSVFAEDDVGLQSVELLIRPLSADAPPMITQTLTGEQPGPQFRDSLPLRLAQLQLASEADEVYLSLRATDNDTLQGPKTSETPPIKLTLLSPERSQQKALESAEQLLREAVAWLAQELTTPWPKQAPDPQAMAVHQHIQEGVQTLAQHIQTFLNQLAQDPMASVDLQHMFKGFAKWTDIALAQRASLFQGQPQSWPERIPRLENMIIALDDTMGLMRIKGLQNTTQRLLHAKQALQSLLQQRAQATSEEEKKRLDAQIAQQRARMLKLISQLRQDERHMPSEFRNQEAATGKHLLDNLQALQESLEKDDIDSAAKHLEDLANDLENIERDLEQAEQNHGADRYRELRQGIEQVQQDLAKLTKDEQALAERMGKAMEQQQDNLAAQGTDLKTIQKTLQELLHKAQLELDHIARVESLPQRQLSQLAQLRRMLLDVGDAIAVQDMAGALGQVEAIEMHNNLLHNQLQYQPQTQPFADKAHQTIEKTTDMLKQLMAQAQRPPTAKQQAQQQQMAKEQQALAKKSQSLMEKMQQLSSEVPYFDGAPQAQMEQATQRMQEAAQSMEQGQVGPARRSAIDAAQQLQQLQESMKQGQDGAKPGQGMPRPGALQPQPKGQGKNKQGEGRGQRHDQDVLIPKQAHNPSRDKFRQDLMEAAKQQAPKRYKEAVRRYYEELVR